MTISRTFRDFLTQISKTDKVALVDAKSEVEISYKELFDKAHDLASRLDIEVGDRVVLFELSQLDWVISFFAIQLRGGIAVPIDERVHETFLKKVVSDIDPVLAITNKDELFEGLATVTYQDLSKKPVNHKHAEESDSG